MEGQPRGFVSRIAVTFIASLLDLISRAILRLCYRFVAVHHMLGYLWCLREDRYATIGVAVVFVGRFFYILIKSCKGLVLEAAAQVDWLRSFDLDVRKFGVDRINSHAM